MQRRAWTNWEWTHQQRGLYKFRSLYLNSPAISLLCHCLELAVIKSCLFASALIVPRCFHHVGTKQPWTCPTKVIVDRMVWSNYSSLTKRTVSDNMIFMLYYSPEIRRLRNWSFSCWARPVVLHQCPHLVLPVCCKAGRAPVLQSNGSCLCPVPLLRSSLLSGSPSQYICQISVLSNSKL